MNLSNLKSYLDKIEQNNPIRLPGFNKLIKQLCLSHDFKPSDIDARKHKGQQYLIIHVHESLHNELKNRVT